MADAISTRCRDAVKATIEGLALPGVLAVHEEPYPDQANRSFPFVSVSVEGVSEVIAPGLNNTNDTGYGVKVAIVDKHHPRDKSKLRERYEPWREAIDTAFRHKRLLGVAESIQCTIEPFPVLDPNLPVYELVVSGLIVRCWTRKNR